MRRNAFLIAGLTIAICLSDLPAFFGANLDPNFQKGTALFQQRSSWKYVENPWKNGEIVKWRAEYYKARKEAQDKQLPLFLLFTKAQGPWCTMLGANSVEDAYLANLLNHYGVPVKIGAEEIDNVVLLRHLRVSSFPTIIIAGPDGKILSTLKGYRKVSELRREVTEAFQKLGSSQK